MNLKLQHYKLLVIFIILLSVIAGMSYFWQFEASVKVLRKSTLTQADTRAQQLADSVGDQVEFLFRNIDFALHELSDSWINSFDEFKTTERKLRASLPIEALTNVTIIDPDGYTYYTAGTKKKGVNLRDREHFKIHLNSKNNELYISTPLKGRIAHGWNIFISRPIFDNGTFAGVVVIGLSSDFLSKWIDTIELMPGNIIVLLRNDGTFLARNINWEKAMGKKVIHSRPFIGNEAPARGSFRAPATLDSTPRIFGWNRIEIGNLVIVIGLKQSTVTANIDKKYNKDLISTLLLSFLLFILGVSISVLLIRFGRQQEVLKTERDFADNLVETAQAIILVLDTKGNIIRYNTFFEELSGYKLKEKKGQSWFDTFIPASEIKHLYTLFSESLNGAKIKINIHSIMSKDGRKIEVEWFSKLIKDSNKKTTGLLAIGHDVTERKLAEQKIQFMAFHDVLTGLPNRQLFSDRLNQAISMARRSHKLLAICYLDLDGFKPVNDSLGHEMGDKLLIEFSNRLQHLLRDEDTLARIGGDEFVVLLNDLSNFIQGEDVIKRILKAIDQPFDIEDKQLNVTASIGVTIFPYDDSDPDVLLRHADQAMYSAKDSGKNTFCLYESTSG